MDAPKNIEVHLLIYADKIVLNLRTSLKTKHCTLL